MNWILIAAIMFCAEIWIALHFAPIPLAIAIAFAIGVPFLLCVLGRVAGTVPGEQQ